MPSKPQRPALGGIDPSDDIDRIRAYGLSKGFLPTDPGAPDSGPASPGAPPPPSLPAPSPDAVPAILRPAPTKPWQAMFPDYLIDALRQTAAHEGTAQKVVVLKALRQAGFRVDDIDLQDLRRR